MRRGYYEGPTENRYIGWTDEEIEEDIRKEEEKAKNLKDWPDPDSEQWFLQKPVK